jgi:hypothetical protein
VDVVPGGVGAVVAAVILFAAVGWTPEPANPGPPDGSARLTAPGDGAANSRNARDNGPFRLVAISASGNRLLVTYGDGSDEVVGAEVPSGWSDDVPNAAGFRANTFSVSTGVDGGGPDEDDTVTCRVTHRGKIVAESTRTGPQITADCGRF